MKSTITMGQWRELLDREARGDFGEEGLGPDLQWLGENWPTVRAIRQGKLGVTAPKSTQLEFINTVNIPALPKFVACDHFKVDRSDEAEVRVSFLGDDFKAWFKRKVEEAKGDPSSLNCYTLERETTDIPIITELGGEAKAETTLAEIWYLMKCQPNGEVTLSMSYPNIFYAYDADNVLQAVGVQRNFGGWCVYATSVGRSFERIGRHQVFSRCLPRRK